jgi:putative membrane protein
MDSWPQQMALPAAEILSADHSRRLAPESDRFYNPQRLRGFGRKLPFRPLPVLTSELLMMTDGFLGYRTSLMLDVVVCALVLVVPAIVYSLYLVKVKRRFVAHRNVQLGLAVVLLIAVGAFEIDMQLVQGGWKNVVGKREVELTVEQLGHVQNVLWIHLVFAVSSPLLWIATIALALKRFPKPPVPCEHSELHKKLGWAATIDLTLTSVTGLWFYYVAFVQ